MAVYPPPLIQSSIFNSALFSEATTAVVSSGNPTPTTEYVEFPNPQGQLNFLQGTGDQTTISSTAITVFQNIGISENGVAFNATGIAYQPPDAAPVAITWDNLATKVEAIGAITQASDATTLNVNNAMQIQNGETQSSPTQYITIRSDNSGNRISLDGSYGEVGQVILSGGENGSLSWGAGGGGGSQSLQEVLDVSNVATNTSIISQNTDGTLTTTLNNAGVGVIYTIGVNDYESNNMGYNANNIANTKADGPYLYNEYSNVATKDTITLQYQDGFITAPTIPNIVSTCGITTEKVELNSYGNNVATSSLTSDTLTVTKKDFLPDYEPEISLEPVVGINVTDGSTLGDKSTTQITESNIQLKKEFEGVEQTLVTIDTTNVALSNSGATSKALVSIGHNNSNGEVNCYNVTNDQTSRLTHSDLQFSSTSGLNIAPYSLMNNDRVECNGTGAQYARLTAANNTPYLDLTTPTNIVNIFSDGLFAYPGNGFGTTGQVLTRLATGNEFGWVDAGGGGGWVGTAESNLDMGTYDITSTSGTLDISATNIEITGQANFVSPPHLPPPILGNDGATKGYVDSLVGQYSGGFNLFMNYSNTDPTFNTFKELSPLVDSAAQQTVPTSLTTNSPFLLSQFITLPLGITEIPIGLWDLFLYALVDTAQDSTTAYFELWKRPATGADVLLGTSGTSGDINNTNTPTSYSMSLTISTTIPLLLTDRIYIKIYGQTTHNNTIVLTTFYEGNNYSFLQTSLNAGTTLLGSDNTWTGTNNFAINPTTPSKTTPADTDIINYADIQRLSTPIVSTLEYYISTLSPYFQYPPQPPTAALINAYQYYGWYFINSVALRKIDWFFAPDYQMTVADVKGLYMNYFNITTTSNDNCPFISIYTKPTGTNDVIPGFAHSVNTFVPTFTPIAASPFCSFMNISGTQQDPFPYGHILGAMAQSTVNNPRGEYLPTEEVLAIAVGTASGAALNQCAFIMSKVGICLEQGNQELILNPQNILEQPTLSTVLSLGSAAGNQSITGVNNLSATSVTTPTLANGANTLTIGTVGQITNIVGTLQNNGSELPAYISSSGVASGSIDMNSNFLTEVGGIDAAGVLAIGQAQASLGVSIGRATQTTNLNGNVQFNSSSGTSGEVLTSTGASTAPTFQALPTPYISAGGVASGSIDMNSNSITECNSLDSVSSLTLGGTTALGTTLGRATQTTNLVGNIQFNSSSGTSGQVLTSTGASTAPTWQPVVSAITYVQGTPVFSGGGFTTAANNYAYQRTTITAPALGATYMFFLNTQISSGNNATNEGFISLGYTNSNANVTTSNGFNAVGNAALSVFLGSLTSLATVRSGTTVADTVTVTPTYIFTFASGSLTKSFCMVTYGGSNFNLGYGYISYIRLA